MISNNIKTDFLIVGSGIAGLWFAHKVSEFGKVCILTKKEDTESNTNYAQGGIAAAFGIDDDPEIHIQDTIRVSKGLAKPEIVRMVCEQFRNCMIQELNSQPIITLLVYYIMI